MPILLADEDFDNRILRGLLRLRPTLDIVRVQDVGLRTRSDNVVLEYAAQEGRVVLTHDITTMTAHGHERVESGRRMPGICVVQRRTPIGVALEDLLLLIDVTTDDEWEGQVRYVPF